ncbi:MAG TPA: arginine deiminase-related protein, partial [Chitinophagales bacterium]|nr:arginine deiminase-related protein [Chitinophagales bacterium]
MSEVQLTDTLFMVRPTHFGWNEQTATTNAFQHQQGNAAQNVVQNVVHEFNHFVKKLRNIGLNVITFDSLQHTPDAVFPNNWISFHTNGTLITYPM